MVTDEYPFYREEWHIRYYKGVRKCWYVRFNVNQTGKTEIEFCDTFERMIVDPRTVWLRKKGEPEPPKLEYHKKCKHCKNDFIVKYRNQEYCSRECHEKHSIEMGWQFREDGLRKNLKKNKGQLICDKCGRPVQS